MIPSQFMKSLPTLVAFSFFITAATMAAEPKKVIVCTVTTGFRHSSISLAEKTLQKLADESKAFTIVEFARQPEVQIPKKPNKPKEPSAGADQKAVDRYQAELKK